MFAMRHGHKDHATSETESDNVSMRAIDHDNAKQSTETHWLFRQRNGSTDAVGSGDNRGRCFGVDLRVLKFRNQTP